MMKIISLIASLLLISSHCGAEVQRVNTHGFIVSNTATTSQSAEAVWVALIHHVNQWWPKDHTWWGKGSTLRIDAHAGGCFCEVYANHSAEHMRVVVVEAEKLLRMTGGLGPLQGMGVHGALNWQLHQHPDHSEMTLSYHVSGISADGFTKLAAVVDKVQAAQLQALIDFVNQG